MFIILNRNNYPNLPHSQGGMKFATQISPLRNYYYISIDLEKIKLKKMLTLRKSSSFTNKSQNYLQNIQNLQTFLLKRKKRLVAENHEKANKYFLCLMCFFGNFFAKNNLRYSAWGNMRWYSRASTQFKKADCGTLAIYYFSIEIYKFQIAAKLLILYFGKDWVFSIATKGCH